MVTDIVFYFISFRITHFTSPVYFSFSLTLFQEILVPKRNWTPNQMLSTATYFVLNFLCSDFDVKKMSWWLHKVIWYASGIQQEASGQERRVRCLLCVQWWCADRDHDYLLPPFVIVLTQSESIHSSLAYLMQRLKWVHCKWLYFMLLSSLPRSY